MRVIERIEAAGLAPAEAEAFRLGLEGVVAASRSPSVEHGLVSTLFARLVPEGTAPAPFEDLWPHAELFVTAAIWIAVADGVYGVEEARVVSDLAHGLGFSAGDLATLEARVFDRARAGRD